MDYIPPKNQYPPCMEYIGNNQYKCTRNIIPTITVDPKNLPIRCNICQNVEYPSTVGLIKNFGKAMINYAKSGFKNVTSEEYKERLDICQKCPNFDNGRCKHPGCGCFLSKKAWLASEDCPIGKWPKLKEEIGFLMSNGDLFIPRRENPLSYIKTAQLVTDTYELVKILPTDIDVVVGSARSGMIPATTLSCHYHKPLYSVDDANLSYVGNGWRLRNYDLGEVKKILLVEDTVYNGNTINKCINVLSQKYPNAEIIKASIYCHEKSIHLIDYYGVILNGNHYLEWNLFNSAMIRYSMIDFDGILCYDAKPEEDDDGEKYLNFIRNAVPKNFIRRVPINAIVTARMEKYRDETLKWLSKHGMSVNKLTMGDWSSLSERTLQKVIELKAKAYSESEANIFIESSPQQAQQIFAITQKNVLCPEIGYVLSINPNGNKN